MTDRLTLEIAPQPEGGFLVYRNGRQVKAIERAVDVARWLQDQALDAYETAAEPVETFEVPAGIKPEPRGTLMKLIGGRS